MKSIRERLSEKAARNKLPIMAAMELLPVCNLHCKMCYVRKSMSEVRSAGGLKDAQWWLSVAKQAADMGLLYPLLTGGEPFLHPQFREIFTGMQDMGMQVSINSNATLIDRELAQWLGKHRPIRINITLYGASEESYQNLCGSADAYGKVRQAVALLKEYDVPVKFNASITPDNFADLEKMVSFAKENGSPIQVATYMFPPIRRDSSMVGKNERLSPEDAALARVMADFHQNEPLWFMGQTERYSRFLPLDQVLKLEQNGAQMGMTCRAGLCSAWIDWKGNLSNCGMYGSVELDMAGRSFQDAWKELVEKTAEIRYESHCAVCPNQHLCHPCIVMIYNECGDLNGRPDYVCRMNQEMSRLYREFARKYYPDHPLPDSIPEQADICEL